VIGTMPGQNNATFSIPLNCRADLCIAG